MKSKHTVSMLLWTLTFVIVSLYTYIIFRFSHRGYFPPDDVTIFFQQTHAFLEGPINIKNIIEYLFGMTLFPHPKLTARIYSLISIGLFGHIDMKLAQIVGNAALIYFAYIISNDFKLDKTKRSMFCTIIVALLLVPIVNTFWTISIVSLPFLFIFLYKGFSYQVKERFKTSILFFFLATFTSGQGFLFVIPALIIVGSTSLLGKKLSLNKVYYSISLIAIFCLFMMFIYIPNNNSSRSISIGEADTFTIKLEAFFTFLGGHWSQLVQLESISFAFYAGILTFFAFTYFSVVGFIKKNTESLKLSAFGFYFILLAILATISRLSNLDSEVILINNRYYIHSILFLIITIGLYFRNFNVSLVLYTTLLSFVLVFYSIRISYQYDFFKRSHRLKDHINKGVIINDQSISHVTKHPNRHYEIEKAIKNNLYQIPKDYLPGILHEPHINSKKDELIDRSILITKELTHSNSLWIEYLISRKYSKNYNHIVVLKNQEANKEYYFEPILIELSKFETSQLYKKNINAKSFNDFKQKYSVFLPSGTISIDEGVYSVKLFIQHNKKCHWKKLSSISIEKD